VTLARELTKQFEEVAPLPARDCRDWLDAEPQRSRGEFAIVLHPLPSHAPEPDQAGEQALRLLLPELPVKSAVRIAASLTGASRNALYQQALALRGQAED